MADMIIPKTINGNYQVLLDRAVNTFIGEGFGIVYEEHSGTKSAIKKLSIFIDEVLGEYNYFTAINRCASTLSDAVRHNYLYTRNGKPRMMEEEAILEWVYYHHPELEDGMSFDKVQQKREEYLTSPNLYPFYKVDSIETNVFRRMSRGDNTPSQFLAKNIRSLHKNRHGHLQAEEDTTRRHLYNSYITLLKLWEEGLVPVLYAQGVKPSV